MKKKIIAVLLVTVLLCALAAGCGGKKIVTEEEAKKIALEEADISESDATDIHTHMVTEKGLPCYSIHITTEDGDVSVIIDIATGEVIK